MKSNENESIYTPRDSLIPDPICKEVKLPAGNMIDYSMH